ncbi:MAG: carboxypeptidase-like regulatory domain-containing protein, partial [Methylotenera sp.]|nr:carboxypeptidase-like regulatory domain-containing protein [Flavobacterium sp.]
MKKILISLLILFHFKSFSQLKSKLIDGKSKMPIGYVAIYIENGNIIATADENGEFMLPLQKDN